MPATKLVPAANLGGPCLPGAAVTDSPGECAGSLVLVEELLAVGECCEPSGLSARLGMGSGKSRYGGTFLRRT